jgi:AcrR family transcriptional regulator
MKTVPKEIPEATAAGVDLLETNKPRQERAIRTYEAILSAAGELLVEVGLERISTNLIAERAGVTVPALYRYFPNKYSVLNALGTRLMKRQNEAFVQWHEHYVVGKPVQAMFSNLYELLRATYDATNSMTGGLQIMYGMQALAPLQKARLDGHWFVAQLFGQIWCDQFGVPYSPATEVRARFAVDLGYTAVRLALEDPQLDPDTALMEGAHALRVYLEFTGREAGLTAN